MGDTPVPDNVTVCGLLLAPSTSVNVPGRLPRAEGVKVTVTAHVFLAATAVPQVLLATA